MELKVITFENNTVAQQIEKVQGAAVVVLERGAAMANCAYMSPGSAVLYIDGNPVVGKSGRHDNSVWMVPKTGDVEVTRAACIPSFSNWALTQAVDLGCLNASLNALRLRLHGGTPPR